MTSVSGGQIRQVNCSTTRAGNNYTARQVIDPASVRSDHFAFWHVSDSRPCVVWECVQRVAVLACTPRAPSILARRRMEGLATSDNVLASC